MDEIADLIKAGQEVQIVDNRSGKDLTDITLAQILFEEQKKQKSRMPISLLKEMIRSRGESITDFIQRRVAQPVQTLKEGAERKVDEIVRRSELTVEEKARTVRDFFSSTQRSLDDIYKRLDDRIQGVLASMPDMSKQLDMLRTRIDQIEAKLKLKKKDPPSTS